MTRIIYDSEKAVQFSAELAQTALNKLFDLPEYTAEEVAGEIAPILQCETGNEILNAISREVELIRAYVAVTRADGKAFDDDFISRLGGGFCGERSEKKELIFYGIFGISEAVSDLTPAGADVIVADENGELTLTTDGEKYILRDARRPDEKVNYYQKMEG